jgi:putative hemolysin
MSPVETQHHPQNTLIDLCGAIRSPGRRALFRLVETTVNRVLSLSEVNRLYAQLPTLEAQHNYFPTILRTLSVGYEVTDEDRAKIPAQGPLIVVANHPFGAVDGLVLGDIMTSVRTDSRILGNRILARIPEVKPWIISVDPNGRPDSARANVGSMKSVVRWLRDGGALGVFPSGTVSHLRLRSGVSDPSWHPNVAALVRLTGATVVPVFFEGQNSMVFQLAGLLHPAFRTVLLPSETVKRQHSTVSVRIGRPIPPEKSGRYLEDETLIQYLRFKTYALQRRESPVRMRFVPPHPFLDADQKPLIEAVSVRALSDEIGGLPSTALLHESGDYRVYMATARQIPTTMLEIGRLREKTFRAANEGTGKACDLDEFDKSYLQLFMWNQASREIVGSYRLGRSDEILARRGVEGLYTSSLFKFSRSFIDRMGPALEMGRSFIREEYQRKPTALALLWRGIGEYLVRNPKYKVLFGPVSISRSYQATSMRLMLEYLQRSRGDSTLAAMVRAKNPPRAGLHMEESRAIDVLVEDEDDVSSLISDLEDDNKGMPVLLRYYLRLGARVLSFNVDAAFGDCVDGLILVDLRKTEPKLLKRFMGEDGFLRYSAEAA